MGADNGSFLSGNLVLAAGSDWKSTARPVPVRGRGVLGPPALPCPAPGSQRLRTQVDRRAGGPRQQQGGRSEFTDVTQVSRRPSSVSGRAVEGAEHTQLPGDSEQLASGRENQRLLLSEPAGVWGELSMAEGHRGERLAAKCGA